jgi:hypothetical protein
MEAKAGDVKKILWKGKRYIIEYETPTTGHAWIRVIISEGQDEKGPYAGTFTITDKKIEILPPKEGNAGPKPKEAAPTAAPKEQDIIPVAEDKKNIKPVVKPSDEKPTAVKKQRTVVAPPPLKTVAPTYTGYFQRQQGLGCGRHALNNLLGREVFKKGAVGDVVPFPPPAEPISLLGVCKTVVDMLKKKGVKEVCSASENYDVNTIHAALDVLGYKTEDFTTTVDESGEFLGFVINLGLVSGKPKHWVALKFKQRADDGTVTYDYFDSLNAGPTENITYNVFGLQHPQVYIVKVLLPKGEPINPGDRFVLMENVVEVPKTKVTATDCSVLYDPCTKLPVKDMAALEARIAEIKAKQTTEVKAGGTRRKMKRKGRKTRRGNH